MPSRLGKHNAHKIRETQCPQDQGKWLSWFVNWVCFTYLKGFFHYRYIGKFFLNHELVSERPPRFLSVLRSISYLY